MEAHFGKAARAARTASRKSFRDARATFAPSTSSERPDSERGNAPPMYSLYVFLTGRRVTLSLQSAQHSRALRRYARSGGRLAVAPGISGGSLVELQVGPEAVEAALAAEAGLLVAAERGGGVEAGVRVRPDHARAQALRHREDARALLRPDAGREAVGRVVRLLDRLVGRAEGEHGEDGPEDLLLRDPVALCHVREHRRHEPPTLLGEPAGRLVDLRALLLPGRHELPDLFQLLLRVDRPDVRVLVERVADAERAHPSLQLGDRRLVDRLLHEEPGARAADVALVEVDAVDDALDGLVERGIVEDDVRGLPPELERELLAAPGDRFLDRLAHLRRAREGDLVDAGVLDELGACAAVSGDDVHDSGGKLGLAEDVAEEERRERRRLRRLEDDRVPGRERGRDLPGEHEEREVPGDDLAGDTDRTRPPVGEGVLELVRPARVVEEVRRRERQVDVARLADGLASVERLEHRELARALLEDARDAEEVLRPLACREPGPAVLERVAGGPDREIDVLSARVGDVRELLLRRRAERRLELARARLDPLAPDEEPVALVEVHNLARLRCGRVLEGGGDRRAVLAPLDLSHRAPHRRASAARSSPADPPSRRRSRERRAKNGSGARLRSTARGRSSRRDWASRGPAAASAGSRRAAQSWRDGLARARLARSRLPDRA